MKIITFNVNGIRSAINKGFVDWVSCINPDIICLQEIKINDTSIVEPYFEDLGYHCFWYPAVKKGYSGVAILTKIKPINVEFGMNDPIYDDEGRVLRLDYEDFSVLTAYFPSGSSGDVRQAYKMKFLEDFYVYIKNLPSEMNLIVCGDVNICHQEIDIHNPKTNINTSGFLPEEREWIGKFIDSGFVDTFRLFNVDPHHYTWWTYRAGAKAKNLGWRIDYLFATHNLNHRLVSSKIHTDVLMSDHCPVELILN